MTTNMCIKWLRWIKNMMLPESDQLKALDKSEEALIKLDKIKEVIDKWNDDMIIGNKDALMYLVNIESILNTEEKSLDPEEIKGESIDTVILEFLNKAISESDENTTCEEAREEKARENFHKMIDNYILEHYPPIEKN